MTIVVETYAGQRLTIRNANKEQALEKLAQGGVPADWIDKITVDGVEVPVIDKQDCEHADFDEYFGKCNDCGTTREEIHASTCVPNGFTVDKEFNCCNTCGQELDNETHP